MVMSSKINWQTSRAQRLLPNRGRGIATRGYRTRHSYQGAGYRPCQRSWHRCGSERRTANMLEPGCRLSAERLGTPTCIRPTQRAEALDAQGQLYVSDRVRRASLSVRPAVSLSVLSASRKVPCHNRTPHEMSPHPSSRSRTRALCFQHRASREETHLSTL